MSTIQKLFLGSASRTILSIAQMAVGFFMMPFLVGHLGDHWYGVWSVIGSTVGYMYIMDAGLSSAVGYYVTKRLAVRDEEGVNAVINTALGIYSGVAVCVLLLTATMASLIDVFVNTGSGTHAASLVVLILGSSLAIDFPFSSFGGIIGATLRFELQSYSRFTILILNTALTVFFLGRGYGILALAIIGFSCALLSNIFFYLISKHCFPALKVRWRYFDRTLVRSLMGYSMWSFLSNISIIMKFRLHSVIIASVMGATAVTHFVVGSRLADYFRELLLQATNLTMPVLTKYHTLQQTEQLRDKLLLLTKINTILACFGAGMTIMLGKAFIATWMGAEYMDAYPVLVVLVLAMAVEVMLDPARGAMFSMGHNRFMGVFELVEAALTVIICVVLIRYYGILGVALGTAIPLFLLKLTIVPKVVSDRVDMDWRRFYRSMVPCFLITTVFLLIYGWFAIHYLLADAYLNLLTAGALSVALYAPVVFYLILDKSEVALLMKLVPLRKATLGVVQK